jgi:hypothetical protein
MDSAGNLSPVAADNHLCEAMVTAVTALFTVLAEMDAAPSDQFFLHLHENFTRDNGLMAVFHIVLGNKAVVLDSLLCEEVNGVGFLKQSIPDIFLVPQNLIDVAGVPPLLTGAVEDTVSLQPTGYFQHTGSLKVLPVDALYDFGFLRNNDQSLALILGI